MRQFTEEDKRVIRNFVEHAGDSATFVLTNVLNDLFIGKTMAFDGANLLFNHTIGVDQILEDEKQIVFRALLIKYLQDEGYIYIVDDATTVNPSRMIGNVNNPQLTAKKKLPKDVAHILASVNKRVYVTENLLSLVQNDFKTYEELSLEESMKQTHRATLGLVLSFVAIIIAIIIPFAFKSENLAENNDGSCDQCELMFQLTTMIDSTARDVSAIKDVMSSIDSKLEPKIVTKYKTRYKTKYVTQPATYKVACGDSLELIQVKK